ncbi:MAG: hypothetical protein JWP89_6930 [Schlesneria sp.]|nr:hypothetical protein [Schlesneria sp.]
MSAVVRQQYLGRLHSLRSGCRATFLTSANRRGRTKQVRHAWVNHQPILQDGDHEGRLRHAASRRLAFDPLLFLDEDRLAIGFEVRN